MDDRWDEVAGTRRGRKRSGRSRDRDRKRSRHRDRDDDREMASRRPRKRSRVRMTEEQKVYQAARRRANRKLSFISHFVSYATVCTFLLFIAGFKVATIVALSWGIGIVFHYFFALAAPELRQRLIDREVNREVQVSVSRERRSIEEKNARQIEQLSASIAHEIRNPITAAKSLVQQMGEDPNSEDSVAYANVALEELDRVERSISHLLRFAREEEIRMGEVRLRDVVISATETFRDRVERTGVRIQQEIDSEGVMRGDPEKLRRVIINLIGNAIKFTESGEVSVSAKPHMDNLAITVSDTGIGIPEDKIERIFKSFQQADGSIARQYGGTGLGLALTRQLVELHGGRMILESEPEAGTSVTLRFPPDRTQ